MRHGSQSIASIFIKKNIEDNFPTTISELNNCLEQTPSDKLPDQIMHFGATLHGTWSFWQKSKNILTDMISQLGWPTFFFTLSATNTKWPDLHAVMPRTPPTSFRKHQQWRIQNIISNPHLALLYMHHRFTIFREEVLVQHLHAHDFWYR